MVTVWKIILHFIHDVGVFQLTAINPGYKCILWQGSLGTPHSGGSEEEAKQVAKNI